jgi:hypothetical protein
MDYTSDAAVSKIQQSLEKEKAKSGVLSLLPSFFIVGPPRTGTSWLHKILSSRTELPRITKETRFFDAHFQRGLLWYRAHFKKNASRVVGEVAPTYFASDEARERIARTIPSAKIVCIFRNPVDRVFSLYRLKRAYGMIPWSFEEAIQRDPELLESGKYATKLKAWLNAFGPGQILPTVYEDLQEGPQSYVDRLADFIGIPRFVISKQDIHYVHSAETMTHPRMYLRTHSATLLADWFKARRLDGIVALARDSFLRRFVLGGGPVFANPSPEVTTRLCKSFVPEIEQLERLMKRDFSAWKRVA